MSDNLHPHTGQTGLTKLKIKQMSCDATRGISILTLFTALTVTPYTVKGLKLLMVRVVS